MKFELASSVRLCGSSLKQSIVLLSQEDERAALKKTEIWNSTNHERKTKEVDLPLAISRHGPKVLVLFIQAQAHRLPR